MSNMSYCRFENTAADVGDCLDALQECVGVQDLYNNLSSTHEKQGFKDFFQSCLAVVEGYSEMFEKLEDGEE